MHITLHHLSKSYDGQTPAVQDVSLAIPAGQITALLGPSGCGKTTILKMMAGLLVPASGDILFGGQSVLAIPAEERSAVMVFQNHLLFPYMTVGENVGFGLKMRGMDKGTITRRVSEMLDLVKLPGLEKRRPRELSGGQQQRVALARALIIEPELLLLDEPLSNLDAHLKDEMRELILHLQRQLGLTTVVVTHDQQTAVILADQIALLFEGVLHQVARPRIFYEQPASMQVAQFFGGVNFLPGTKEGEVVHTDWGCFAAAPSSLPDGPVWLTIRPEQVRLSQNGVSNSLPARVVSQTYLGTHTKLKLNAAAIPLEMRSPDPDSCHLCPGDTVNLYLPPDKTWLLPVDE
jgi:ABC-type Fe3+/spermidine/putrescine transport system ATPase subunit